MKKRKTVKMTPLEKILSGHKKSCTYFIFSGDRHCSCGHAEAVAQVRMLLRLAFLYLKTSG